MRSLLFKAFICLFVFGFCLYNTIDKQNTLTRMRMQIPLLAKQLKEIQEENTRLQYAIDAFESPQHLLELSCQNAYAHLKHPLNSEVSACLAGTAIKPGNQEKVPLPHQPRLSLASGVHR